MGFEVWCARAMRVAVRFRFGFWKLQGFWVALGILLGGSGVVISGVISPLIWVISIVTLLITPRLQAGDDPERR